MCLFAEQYSWTLSLTLKDTSQILEPIPRIHQGILGIGEKSEWAAMVVQKVDAYPLPPLTPMPFSLVEEPAPESLNSGVGGEEALMMGELKINFSTYHNPWLTKIPGF